jgi:hypothetical protein
MSDSVKRVSHHKRRSRRRPSPCEEDGVSLLEGDGETLEEVTRGGLIVDVISSTNISGNGLEEVYCSAFPSPESLYGKGEEVNAYIPASTLVAVQLPLQHSGLVLVGWGK